jgi:hypothetical protein
MNPVSFFLGAHQASALHLERAIVVKVDLHELIGLEGISGVSTFSIGAVVGTLSVVLFVCVFYVCIHMYVITQQNMKQCDITDYFYFLVSK